MNTKCKSLLKHSPDVNCDELSSKYRDPFVQKGRSNLSDKTGAARPPSSRAKELPG